jgi:acetyl-CoA synthetase
MGMVSNLKNNCLLPTVLIMFNLAETICRKHEDASFRIALEEPRSCGSNSYTFGGLDFLSDKFARVLQSDGIKQGDVVAVILHPSAALIVAHFAALKLAAIVAPFPPELPSDLLESLMIEIEVKALVLNETLFEEAENLIPEFKDRPVYIASDAVSQKDFGQCGKGFWRHINEADGEVKPASTFATTPAYVFFEQVENSHLTQTYFFHGLIYDGLRETEKPNDSANQNGEPRSSIDDWSSKNVLFDELYPAWFSGCSVEIDDSKGNEKAQS